MTGVQTSESENCAARESVPHSFEPKRDRILSFTCDAKQVWEVALQLTWEIKQGYERVTEVRCFVAGGEDVRQVCNLAADYWSEEQVHYVDEGDSDAYAPVKRLRVIYCRNHNTWTFAPVGENVVLIYREDE